MSGEWQHGLLGCFDNFGLCLISYFLPCYQFGRNAEAVGESCISCGTAYLCLCSCTSFLPLVYPSAASILGWYMRTKIRERKGINGTLSKDLLIWCCCPLCALIQEAQEVQDIRPAVVQPVSTQPVTQQPASKATTQK